MRKYLGAAALMAAMVAAAPAQAALVVDQSFVASPVTLAATPSMQGGAVRRAQTFTTGMAGVLEEVRIQLAEPAAFLGLNIYATAAERPTQQLLATGTYRGAENGYAVFDVSLAIVAGQVLALDPYAAAGQFTTAWAGTTADRYAGGSFFLSQDGGASYGRFANDLGFQTLVRTADAAAVPEPATWATMILGLGAVGAAARGRRAARKSYRNPARALHL